MSNTLSLATRLRSMDDADLAAAVRSRGLSITGIKDFFDLAEAFLDPASVQQMLTRLERDTLAVIGTIAESERPIGAADVAARLTAAGNGTADIDTADIDTATLESVASRIAFAVDLLILEQESDHYTAYDSVRDRLKAWPSIGLPSIAELAAGSPPAALEPVPDVDRRFIDRLAAERAFAATTAITELLTELEREPARELARGGLALPDGKRLSGAMAIELDAVAEFLAVADQSGLVALDAATWMITDRGGSWLLESTGERWASLAGAWFDQLPGDIRALLSERSTSLWGAGLRSYIDWLYPAGGGWMDERASANTRHAELLGITANQAPSTPGTFVLSGRIDAAEETISTLLPPEVEQVYLQHDLSVIAPGPLTPRVDARLRSLADVESRALASSYRISVSSVNRAMAAGETAESLLEFLSSVSLTGIPQPLAYLIAEVSQRYGLIRVGEQLEPGPEQLEFEAHSYLRSEDAGLLAAIAVDQNLASLGLKRVAADRVLSRLPFDVVFWALSEARYPVAAENADGEIIALRRRHSTRVALAPAIDPVDALIERLRLGSGMDAAETGQAWLVRQLETAIRAHAALTVSITMPNGTVIDYQLEPTSLGGGRLRARDRKSAIERTLPLSSIASVGPVS
jgi:hypothetical protein